MAHPERYEYLKTISDFQALKEKGCNFQLNLLSISGHYGTTVTAKNCILQNGFIDFIAPMLTDRNISLKLNNLQFQKRSWKRYKIA